MPSDGFKRLQVVVLSVLRAVTATTTLRVVTQSTPESSRRRRATTYETCRLGRMVYLATSMGPALVTQNVVISKQALFVAALSPTQVGPVGIGGLLLMSQPAPWMFNKMLKWAKARKRNPIRTGELQPSKSLEVS